jgi:hypothetical protein
MSDIAPQPRPWIAREPCPNCGSTNAAIWPRNGQNVVTCNDCDRFLYNAPKHETGEAPRTVATLRPNLKPSQQARILDRDLRRCIMCGTRDNLCIGHFLSVKDGLALGVPMEVIESDENKAAMCEADNLGLQAHSVSARFYVSLLAALLHPDVRTTP